MLAVDKQQAVDQLRLRHPLHRRLPVCVCVCVCAAAAAAFGFLSVYLQLACKMSGFQDAEEKLAVVLVKDSDMLKTRICSSVCVNRGPEARAARTRLRRGGVDMCTRSLINSNSRL